MGTPWRAAARTTAVSLLAAACSAPDPIEPAATPARTPALTAARATANRLGGSIANHRAMASARASGLASQMDVTSIRRIETLFGTDYVSSGIGGLRDISTAYNIQVLGVSGTVSRALLYWHGPTNSSNTAANASVQFGGQPIVGTNIGLSNDNCWGYDNSQGYVADVTSIVAPIGNGAYAFQGYGFGPDVPGAANTNGASVIVFFNDANGANNRDVVLYHGNDSNIPNEFDADNWNVTLDGINYRGGTANLELHVSDGQIFDDDAITINGNQLIPAGPNWQGLTVIGPSLGPDNNGRLWDIRRFDVTSFLTQGLNTLSVFSGVNQDCLSLVVALIDLPAGAAPTPDIAFVPTTISLTRTGTVTVYLYSAPGFDASLAEPAEARLVIDNRLPGAPVAQRNGVYLTGVRDYNGDGLADRAMIFTMADLRAAGLATNSSSFVLRDATGTFRYDGRPVSLPTIVP